MTNLIPFEVLMRNVLLVFLAICSTNSSAQIPTGTTASDTMQTGLPEVVIRAYENDLSMLKVPAAVSVINHNDLNRFGNISILPAVNNTAGVRMEERSPGSYRLGIRGSSSNTPFGVRNIKVYYNGIPYTDAGGNTYLNQLGYYNFHSIEFIREPGSSLYGAGIGGVMLINSMPETWQRGGAVHYTAGSYGLQSMAAEVRAGDSGFRNVVRFQHLQSDGYREQPALRKDALSWDTRIKAGSKGELTTNILYGALQYQTPGGLTLQQFNTDARQARPASGSIPGAVENKAAIYQRTFLSGLTYSYHFNSKWQNTTTLYGRFTSLINPNIRNYSNVQQTGFGGRSILKFDTKAGMSGIQWLIGIEGQQGSSHENTYDNVAGNSGALQQQTEVENILTSGFTQATWQRRKWLLSAGISLNVLSVSIISRYPLPYMQLHRQFNNQLAPRLAILYRVAENTSLYASVSEGYSPPTTEELAPTGSKINASLNPARGTNYQAGIKGYLLTQRLYYDLTAFYLAVTDAVVQRRDAAGGDYYINAGSTQQAGIEANIRYSMVNKQSGFIRQASAFASGSRYHFVYNEFIQAGNDYSGNYMPGIAPVTVAGGLSLTSSLNIYTDINCYYSDIIPLNDANTISGGAYILCDVKVGVRLPYRNYLLNIYGGINNLLNQSYSLGNDINAFGGRYFNAAPGINYFAGLSVVFDR
ncbi:MAG TPA: TonB-dependent receptor [Flavipsychrobacter sp.]